MRTLKMQFTLSNNKTLLISLNNAKDPLTADEVRGFMNQAVAKNMFDINGVKPTAAKAAYIETSNSSSIF